MKRIFLFLFVLILSNSLLAQTPLQKADTAFKNKDYVSAVKYYNKALGKATPDQVTRINFKMGECYRYGNNYTEAKNWYQKAIDSGCNDSMLYYHMGNMLLKLGSYSDAITYFEKYLTVKPNDQLAKIKIESCQLGLKSKTNKPLHEVKVESNLCSTTSDYGIAYLSSTKVVLASTRMDLLGKYDPATMQGFSDLYESTYNTDKKEWSKPSAFKGPVNTSFNEGTFTYSTKSKIGYYMQCNGETGKKTNCNIMCSEYNENADSWGTPKIFDYNSNTFSVGHPSISINDSVMYIVSDMPGGFGGKDIYIIKKTDGKWGQPENLGTLINTVGDEMFPFLSGDSLLVFASDGQPGFGGLDIFTSKISKGKYGKPVNMMYPFNTSFDDFGLIFINSKDEGFFCSNRTGGVGDDDIYSYSKIPVILTAVGYVRDKQTEKGLDNAIVYFKGSDGSIDSAITDNKGKYEFTRMKPNMKYTIKGTRDGYLNDSKKFNTDNDIYSRSYNKDGGYDLDFALIKITKEEVKINNIFYDYDKADLRPESKVELDVLVNILKETPDVNVQISSHSDERGAEKYNTELSQRRAQSVVDYLISCGISSSRLIAKGYGFAMPVIKGAKTEEEHQKNRRTTFKILSSNATSSSETYTEPTTTNTGLSKYYVISGAYNTQNEADDAVETLKKAGYSKAFVVGLYETNKWRVAFAEYKNKAEASTALESIKKVYPSAWVYEKK